jgi:hypothetical protein
MEKNSLGELAAVYHGITIRFAPSVSKIEWLSVLVKLLKHALHSITYDSLVLKIFEGLPSNAGLNIGGQSLDTLRIAHATSLMSHVWSYRSQYILSREYWAMPGCFAAALAVLQYLSQGTVQHDVFVKACKALAEMSEMLPIANSFLDDINRLVPMYGISLPHYTAKYFLGSRSHMYTSAGGVSIGPRDKEGGLGDEHSGRDSSQATFTELLDMMNTSEMPLD